jgi:predicted metalloprotease with PDZ domain
MTSTRIGQVACAMAGCVTAACLLASPAGSSHQTAASPAPRHLAEAAKPPNVGEPCGWIGVTVTPMTTVIAESLGLTEPYGAIFGPPDPGSPAAAAGIEQGDILTAVNGATLVRASDFAAIISAMAPSTTVVLDTLRDGQGRQVQVPLGAAPCRTNG